MAALLRAILPTLPSPALRARLAAAARGLPRAVRRRACRAPPQARAGPRRPARRRPRSRSSCSARATSPRWRRSTATAYPETWFTAADARDRAVRRHQARRPARLRRGRARLLAHLGSRGTRERRDAAGAPGPGARAGCVCGALPAVARRRDRDDRAQRPRRQRRRRSRAYARLGFEPVTPYWEAASSSGPARSAGHACVGLGVRRARSGQRCPKWCARGSADPTSSSATRRASTPRVSIEVTRMFRFSPTRS